MKTFFTKTAFAPLFAFVFISGVYLFLHKGFFRKITYTAGTVDKVFLDTSHISSSEITLYTEGTFSRKDDNYFFHHFYSGTYKVMEENIHLHYDGDDVPDHELTTGVLYPPTLSLFSISEENAGDTTTIVYSQMINN